MHLKFKHRQSWFGFENCFSSLEILDLIWECENKITNKQAALGGHVQFNQQKRKPTDIKRQKNKFIEDDSPLNQENMKD